MSNQSLLGAPPRSPLAREALDASAAVQWANMFKALGDPVRLRLVSLIASHAGGEACVCDISGTIDLSQPTISHHLKVLRCAGLLECERRGTWVYYRVIPAAMRQLSAILQIDAVISPSEICTEEVSA
jgi:ArsR family transcriptional regulator